MITLRKAEIKEGEKILAFYQNVIESIKNSEFRPKWNETYPNLEYIETCIGNKELYIYPEHDEIIACVVLNNRFEPEYENINWSVNAKPDETIMIHTFAVSSEFSGKGIGKELFNQIRNDAAKSGKKTIRIDIINGNTGAQKAFENFGFEYVDTAEMFHPAVGLEKFHLYEYDLNHRKQNDI